MKNNMLIALLVVSAQFASSQSISPSLKNFTIEDHPLGVVGGLEILTFFKKLPPYLFPFKTREELTTAYNGEDLRLNGLTGASIRPSFDGSKTNSVLVELLSAVPWKICRFGVSTSIVQSDLADSSKTGQEVAFQKLTNGGGNIIVTLSRPLVAKSFNQKLGGWFLLNVDVSTYFDINEINQDQYNPGAGLLLNPSFDLRLINTNSGNGFRFGIFGRYQYQALNEKYREMNIIDQRFNKLGIGSIGAYIGGAMLNLQYSLNSYSNKDDFFKGKSSLIRLELIPVKF